jgi:hypothetical protein
LLDRLSTYREFEQQALRGAEDACRLGAAAGIQPAR